MEHIVTQLIERDVYFKITSTQRRLRARLRYISTDPYAIEIRFHKQAVWAISRELLQQGLSLPSGEGDVRITTRMTWIGRRFVLRLKSSTEWFELTVSYRVIRRFLASTQQIIPVGTESQYLDVDALVDQLLKR